MKAAASNQIEGLEYGRLRGAKHGWVAPVERHDERAGPLRDAGLARHSLSLAGA